MPTRAPLAYIESVECPGCTSRSQLSCSSADCRASQVSSARASFSFPILHGRKATPEATWRCDGCSAMALDARALPAVSVSAPDVGVASAWSENGGEASSAAVSVGVPVLWSDERRMKRELVAWAKAVASMAIRASMQC
ncbi:uncharacterized protein LOC133887771 [Phragmites australis]|uniref:uncharacterized protein LOC133887771 n=1 Tax=Phragmites australis TaxID=29695 RepID=UPI002D7894F5|nr:uncharacterized protein LOC133887771 [Phragmites australis]